MKFLIVQINRFPSFVCLTAIIYCCALHTETVHLFLSPRQHSPPINVNEMLCGWCSVFHFCLVFRRCFGWFILDWNDEWALSFENVQSCKRFRWMIQQICRLLSVTLNDYHFIRGKIQKKYGFIAARYLTFQFESHCSPANRWNIEKMAWRILWMPKESFGAKCLFASRSIWGVSVAQGFGEHPARVHVQGWVGGETIDESEKLGTMLDLCRIELHPNSVHETV